MTKIKEEDKKYSFVYQSKFARFWIIFGGPLANFLLAYFHKPVSYKNYIPDRLGHDRRYLLDSTKIKETLNWQPKIGFETGLKQTIAWYQENSAWWAPLL